MAWSAIDRFCQWLSPRKDLLIGVVGVAVAEMASAAPIARMAVGGIAIKLLGEVARYGVQRLLDRKVDIPEIKGVDQEFPREQIQEINDWLEKLTTDYHRLLDELVKMVGDVQETQDRTEFVRKALQDRADLQLEFAAHRSDVQGMILSLSRIELKLDQFQADFQTFLRLFPGFQEYTKLSIQVQQLLLKSSRLHLEGRHKEAAAVLVASLRDKGVGRATILKIVEAVYPARVESTEAYDEHRAGIAGVLPAIPQPNRSSPPPPISAKAASWSAAHPQTVTALAFSPDSQYLLSGDKNGTIRLWETASGACVRQFVPWPPITYSRDLADHQMQGALAVAFSEDGSRALAILDAGLLLSWDIMTGHEIQRFGPDKAYFYSCWRYVPHRGHYAFRGNSSDKRIKTPHAFFSSAVISTNGRMGIIDGVHDCSQDVCLELYDFQNHAAFSDCNIPEIYDLFTLSPRGDQAASVWNGSDREDGKGRYPGYISTYWPSVKPVYGSYREFIFTDIIRSMVYSPSGERLLIGTEGGLLRLFNVATCDEIKKFGAHAHPISAVAYTPDGQRAISGGEDGTIRWWNIDTGAELSPCEGHTAAINTLACSPDGLWIASGSNDRTIRVWRIWPLEFLRMYQF